VGARAVLWDIDGTLVLSEPFHFRALRGVTAEYGIELPDSFHEEMVGRTAEETFILICERYGLEESFARWVAKKYRRYVETAPQRSPRARGRWRRSTRCGKRTCRRRWCRTRTGSWSMPTFAPWGFCSRGW
jgi:FMN phosphatase YigB (HAD superfamily)